ncbi:MAG TPA: hypothetical protein VE089_08180 [Nitrososphaeraceae archaeon]|nr:hypothetical protein [Nitrososphaeraceae archaeon]
MQQWIYLANNNKGERYNNYHRSTLKILILAIIISIIIANSIIIFSDPHYRLPTALWTMNITAAVASSLGIIAIYRHGVYGLHGKSYLFLTLGILSWFCADLTLLYYYYAMDIEEQKLVTVTDGFWFAGYGFLSLHLFYVIRSLNNNNNAIKPKFVIIISIIIVLAFVSFNAFNLVSSEFLLDASKDKQRMENLLSLFVTIAYPILDLILIIPSSIILIILRKNYHHSIPWFLSSVSLLINAIADDGYVIDFVNGNSHHLIFWDLFYVADFIIMAGALFWYHIYHITSSIASRKIIGL